MRRRWFLALLFGSAGLVFGCGGPTAMDDRGTAATARPTGTPIALPTPTFSGTPRDRARGVITRIDDEALTFRDIDGTELTLRPGPSLQFPWEELKNLHQQRTRITVVYEQNPGGPVLVDVFPN